MKSGILVLLMFCVCAVILAQDNDHSHDSDDHSSHDHSSHDHAHSSDENMAIGFHPGLA